MESRWKDFSLYKRSLIIILVILFLFSMTGNLDVISGIIRRFFNVLAPFIIGCTIAYFLSRPVIKLDERLNKSKADFVRRNSHVLATIAIFLIVITFVTIVVSHVGPIIIANLRDFIENCGSGSGRRR